MRHVTIWYHLINVDDLLQDRSKKHITGTLAGAPPGLFSEWDHNKAVTLVSLQNGNSFSNPKRGADSLATGVHCNRVEAL